MKIPGFSKYNIEKDGTITNNCGQRMSFSPDGNGYMKVRLRSDGRKSVTKLVHRLVMETFSPMNSMDKLFVLFKDGDRSNYSWYNLIWSTEKKEYTHFNLGNWWKGRKRPESTIKKFRRAKRGSNHPKYVGKKMVDGVIYTTYQEAIKDTGMKYSKIKKKMDSWQDTNSRLITNARTRRQNKSRRSSEQTTGEERGVYRSIYPETWTPVLGI